jgi:apolipoprotein N-acyltransferase
VKPLLAAAAAGLGLGVSLPPFDLWFLAPLAYAVLAYALLEDGSRRVKVGRAAAFNFGFFVVGLAWAIEFAVIAFVALLIVEVLLTTVPYALVPRAPRPALIALPALVTIGELIRYRWPMGGLPLAGVALGQANGPLLRLSRLGGDLTIVFVTVLFGVALFALWRDRALGVVGLVVALALVIVPTSPPEPVSSLRVAYVQGGGPRGLRAVENTETDVYGNQVDAMAKLGSKVDLVVWPEDVIDLPGPVTEDPVRREIGALATAAEATLVAGVVEDEGLEHFRNAAVAWDRSGKIVDRYEKVHRVPFGEFVPWRGLVSKLADISAVPRDAIAGTGDGVLLTRAGDLGVLISYEVFFADRAAAAIRGGAEILLVPTNASSFRGRQVPEQEVAAARLRAVETGRDLVQAAPTGHSVFVHANGRTADTSQLGPAAVATETLQMRHGRTPYVRFGDRPLVAFVLLLVAAAVALDRSVKTTD